MIDLIQRTDGGLARNYPKDEIVISIETANALIAKRSWEYFDESTGDKYRVIETLDPVMQGRPKISPFMEQPIERREIEVPEEDLIAVLDNRLKNKFPDYGPNERQDLAMFLISTRMVTQETLWSK